MKKDSFLVKMLFMCFLMLISVGIIHAQKTITGKLTDEVTGEPLIGANVIVKGTTNGTVTDLDGNYTIAASESDVLEYSFIGYDKKEVVVGTQSVINVSLSEGTEFIDELVVIGYGTVKKEDLSGAVAVVTSEDLNRSPSADVTRALQGKAPGVQITQNGEPGGGTRIRIRGVGSINRDANPLYIVDGVVGGDLSAISPQDIETMQVLKDASASAIYGADGANGVVIITTKRGKAGETRINFSAFYGINFKPELIDVMNADQYSDLYSTMYTEYFNAEQPLAYTDGFRKFYYGAGWQEGTNFQEEILQPSNTQNYYLNVSSGNDYSNFSFSTGYLNEKGTLLNTGYQRYNMRLASDFKLGKYIRIGETFSLSYKKVDRNSQTNGNVWDLSLYTSPLMKVYNDSVVGGYDNTTIAIPYINGDTVYNTGANDKANPVTGLAIADNIDYRTDILATVYLELKPLKSLTYKMTPSVRINYDKDYEWTPRFNVPVGGRPNELASLMNRYSHGYYTSLENQITFDKTLWGKHHVNLIGVHFISKNTNTDMTGEKNDYPYESLTTITGGTTIVSLSGGENISSSESLLGRLIYDYDNFVFITASLRRDGTSRFGPQNRYGLFPSFSGAVKVNEYLFPNVDEIGSMKLRYGYGETGFSNIGNYQFTSNLSNFDQFSPVFGTDQRNEIALNQLYSLGNEKLKWESAKMHNVGIDINAFRNKVQFTGEYYNKRTSDLLVKQEISMIHGQVVGSASPWVNLGDLRNRGFEFSLLYRKMEGEFNYSVSANLTTVDNEVLSLPEQLIEGDNITRQDYAIGGLYGVIAERIIQENDFDENGEYLYAKQADGTDPAPGDLKFTDLNNDGIINSLDRTYLGTTIPKYNYGFNLEAYYKSFDFTMFIYGLGKYKIYNQLRRNIETFASQDKDHNKSAAYYEGYWTPERPSTEYIRLDQGNDNNNNQISSWFIEEGSFIRIRDIQLGYTLPPNILNAINVSKFRVYVSLLNLYTFTNYSGRDPEAAINRSSNNGDDLRQGVDDGLYPLPQSFTMGLQIDF